MRNTKLAGTGSGVIGGCRSTANCSRDQAGVDDLINPSGPGGRSKGANLKRTARIPINLNPQY
jgi:hypothetical protein